MEINAALVSMAGAQVSSTNSRGVVGISGRMIDQDDIMRAIESARAIPIPHNQEIIHVIHRGFNVDGQEGIRMPIGMHGYRLEVETHIITASAASTENLRQCVGFSGVEVSQFVLNPLAAAEIALTEAERQMGVLVCDIGGGTTDLASIAKGMCGIPRYLQWEEIISLQILPKDFICLYLKLKRSKSDMAMPFKPK